MENENYKPEQTSTKPNRRMIRLVVLAAIACMVLNFLPVRYEIYCLRHSDTMESLPELIEWYDVVIGPLSLPGDAVFAYPELFFTYPYSSGKLLVSAEKKFGKEMRLVRVNENSRFCSSITIEPEDCSMVPFEVVSYVYRTESDGGNWIGFGVYMYENYELALIKAKRSEINAIAEKYGLTVKYDGDGINVFIDSAEKAEDAARFCVETDVLLGEYICRTYEREPHKFPRFVKADVYADRSISGKKEYCVGNYELLYRNYDEINAEDAISSLKDKIQGNFKQYEKYN